jgi:hypothetical protein
MCLRLQALMLVILSSLAGRDWPSPAEDQRLQEELRRVNDLFRGPAACGVADHQNLPVAWDAARGIHIKWRMARPGIRHHCH